MTNRSVQKWSLYENGKKFWESQKKGEKKMAAGSKYRLVVLGFVMSAQAS